MQASRLCCAASRTRSRRSPTTRSRRWRRCSGRSTRRTGASSPSPAAPAQADAEIVDFLVYRPRPRRERSYRILRTDRGFRIEGTPPDEVELEEALRAVGARKGSEVEVGEETFELP